MEQVREEREKARERAREEKEREQAEERAREEKERGLRKKVKRRVRDLEIDAGFSCLPVGFE
jgi:hypothetical protein